ncbi:hypothetical protein NMG60_11025500 [Bertholletia excelsa]
MAGTASDESGVGRSLEGISSGQQRCQSNEALPEWRSSEQVENGIPSSSPPYWDTDDDDDDPGPKPSQLYGKFTWKIDKFSQINKRELRSKEFEVGGYKWYILIYPQGCDVCNHLSLFLCVANHDKLLPGWSHFAQFTIAVVNKDPKKSKYSDTLHRFCKKEHDWGWKKFMELSKVLDGFIDADTLIIKAQVQVIREKADRPFRCLDCQYRRELVRVYLTNVEQICRRFVEERRSKLGKLIEDKARWSSFCAFWLGFDQNVRRRMSREKTHVILKLVVKHFFIEKEVTSTLVMDSLYSGLKALEGQSKSKKSRGKVQEVEELAVSVVHIEKDTFVLVDDILLLLERAAMEPLPPKDEKGPQNRTKDVGSGEDFNKDSIERDERRLTELGRRTIEIFVLDHIFSKIEVAYQEAVALERQEELIREEEAACLAEVEQKAKRGASEKEKKQKKKQGKQKRRNGKGKDKGKDDKHGVGIQDKLQQECLADERKDSLNEEAEPVLEKPDMLEDGSDASDSVDCPSEMLQPDSEDRDGSSFNWDTDASEVHLPIEASSSGVTGSPAAPNGMRERNGLSVVDDSSSTCSTDSVPSAVMNAPYKGNSFPNQKSQRLSSRGKNQVAKASNDVTGWANEAQSQPPVRTKDGAQNDVSASSKPESESEAVAPSLHHRVRGLEHRVVKKVDKEEVSARRELNSKEQTDIERPAKDRVMSMPSSPSCPLKNIPSSVQAKSESKTAAVSDSLSGRKPSSGSPQQVERSTLSINSADLTVSSKSDTHTLGVPKPTEKPNLPQVPAMSRPLSAPVIPGGPGPRPTAPVVPLAQTTPLLSRSVSAAGRLGPDPLAATHSYVPQSYRNAIMGTSVAPSSASYTQPHSPSSAVNASQSYIQPPNLLSAPIYLPQGSDRVEPKLVKQSFAFGMVNHDTLQNGPQWMESPLMDSSRSMQYNPSSDFHMPLCGPSQDDIPPESPAGTSGHQSHSLLPDEFPHLHIIDYLFNDEHGMAKAGRGNTSYQGFGNGPRHLNRQFTFPGDGGLANDVGASTGSCRFERNRSYPDDGCQYGYGSLGGHFDPLGDVIPQSNSQPYANGQIDGMIPNQWQMGGSDHLSFISTRDVESDGYPYQIPDYSNMACRLNGYTAFRPSNGH